MLVLLSDDRFMVPERTLLFHVLISDLVFYFSIHEMSLQQARLIKVSLALFVDFVGAQCIVDIT